MRFRRAASMILPLVLTTLLLLTSSPVIMYASGSSGGEVIRDYWPTNGWLNSTPEEQGMSSAILEQMMDHINDSALDIHSVIVVRHGYVVLEEYPFPFQGQPRTMSFNDTHYLYSTTKSFTSALIGMAMDKGYIDNLSQTVLSLFPERTFANMDERKERITLRNLLTMQSGLPWDESSAPFTSPENDVYQLNYNSSGGVQFTLDKPMQYEPGTVFVYNTGASHVLSGIVQEVTGMQTSEFAEEYLFDPLGIQAYYWPSDTQGVSFGGFDLQLRPRDMAKFGFLYLNNGSWDGQQIISGEYVTESVQTVTTLTATHGYGYQWHTMPDRNVWFTAGLYGQYIFVAPDQDLVAVFTSGYGLSDSDENPGMLRDYILAAVTDQSGMEILVLGALIATPLIVLAVGAVLYLRRR